MTPETEQAHRDSVNAAIAMMSSDPAAPLDVAAMAYAAGLSRYYFGRVFKHLTGVSPTRKLADLRFTEAARLLATTETSVQEVAYAVGYTSVGRFMSTFTERYGCSPSIYRQQAKDGAA